MVPSAGCRVTHLARSGSLSSSKFVHSLFSFDIAAVAPSSVVTTGVNFTTTNASRHPANKAEAAPGLRRPGGAGVHPLGGPADAAEGEEMETVDWCVCLLGIDQRRDERIWGSFGEDPRKGGVTTRESTQRSADTTAECKFGEGGDIGGPGDANLDRTIDTSRPQRSDPTMHWFGVKAELGDQ